MYDSPDHDRLPCDPTPAEIARAAAKLKQRELATMRKAPTPNLLRERKRLKRLYRVRR